MNILDILKKMEYDVIAFDSRVGIYQVKFNSTRRKRLQRLIEKDKDKDLLEKGIDLHEIYHVKVSSVSFNELGNLFVTFSEEKDKCERFDYYDSEAYIED